MIWLHSEKCSHQELWSCFWCWRFCLQLISAAFLHTGSKRRRICRQSPEPAAFGYRDRGKPRHDIWQRRKHTRTVGYCMDSFPWPVKYHRRKQAEDCRLSCFRFWVWRWGKARPAWKEQGRQQISGSCEKCRKQREREDCRVCIRKQAFALHRFWREHTQVLSLRKTCFFGNRIYRRR